MSRLVDRDDNTFIVEINDVKLLITLEERDGKFCFKSLEIIK